MAVDTPATIAILGAGPIGLEAALYARYLGYDVSLYESHSHVAGEVLRYSHLELDSPFAAHVSPLGIAALKAQNPDHPFPPAEAALRAHQWHEAYLAPLAASDLIVDSLHLGTTVLQVGKVEITRNDQPRGEYDRGSWDFRLLLRGREGESFLATADVVLDCTGQSSHPLPAGHGGIPALGEEHVARTSGRIHYGPVDLAGAVGEPLAGKRVLVVGEDRALVHTLRALAKLRQRAPGTEVTWFSCRESPLPLQWDGTGGSGITPSTTWAAWLAEANQFAASGALQIQSETWLEEVQQDDAGALRVRLAGAHEGWFTCDQLVVHNGTRPDLLLTRELQLVADPLEPASWRTSEPNYYQLGARRWGRHAGATYAAGCQDIREVFALLADRSDLDLYAKFT